MNNRNVAYQPPFPYFGGKSTIADLIWQSIGSDVANYVEPFCGSAATLFLRPDQDIGLETINDADGFVSNFWRSVRYAPSIVAEHADWIVDECTLHARHLWLIGQRESLTDRLCGDCNYFDAKVAGYWAWGLSCWIGSEFCSGKGPWQSVDGVMTDTRKLPHLGNHGRGVTRQLPHLGDHGSGVTRQLPHLGDHGRGECDARREWLISYMQTLANRLRNVRICCGDWNRVCGQSVTYKHGTTGVFLDPPYADTASRTKDLYAVDCMQVAHDVRRWAIENGSNPLLRIIICGYQDEHEMPSDWRVVEWKARGGYGNQGDDNHNRTRERLWLSPHCLNQTKETQMQLFDFSGA